MIAFQFLPNRLAAIALSGFGVLAIALAAGGIYGVVAFAAARRRRELGIRLALGATARGLVQLVLGRTAVIVSTAVVIGLVIAVALNRVLANVVYLSSGPDPVVLGGALVVMVIVSAIASWVPTRQSLRTDPIEAIRTD